MSTTPTTSRSSALSLSFIFFITLFVTLPTMSFIEGNKAYAISPPSVTLTLSGGTSWFKGGEIGEGTKRGFLVSLKNQIGWRNFGVVLGIARSDYLTTQSAPPFNHLIGFYDFQVGLSGYYTLHNVRFQLDPSYRRYGILSNALIRTTGTGSSGYHAVGVDLEIGYWIANVEIAVRPSVYYLFGAETMQINLELVAGISFGNQ